jgi:hypothetical protein
MRHKPYAGLAEMLASAVSGRAAMRGVRYVNGMVWVRVLIGAVWLNGGLEKLLNPGFPGQFAASLQAGGFVSQAPPFFQ